MKCSETQISIAEDVETCSNAPISTITNGPQSLRGSNHHPVNTNGSIITMTLKNNHLIVETEERNDIQEDSRETKMTYSPSARDGVFVVEVQQGSKRSPGSGGPFSCVEAVASGSTSDQCALVHNPPDRYSDEDTLDEYDEAEYYVETPSPATNGTETMSSLRCQLQTGLCQSDRSISSANQTYTYGNQQGYCSGSFGYPFYNGYIDDDADEPAQRSVKKDCHKPKIISEIYKSNSVIKASFEVLDELSCDNSGPVKHPSFERSNSRDVGASLERTPNQLNTSQTDQQNRASSIMTNDATEKQFDEEQKRLGNSKTNDDPVQCKLEQTSTATLDRQLPNNNINGLESCQIIQNEPTGNSSNISVVNNNTTENCLAVTEVA
ncbi:uncharacterized protein LOC108742327 [Agrilus planipennis]|uniref:Uncharacterized protein LOC108742327 n=1 Tax=Agrilus planipennis TaxID=224129 RepID=A0A1W4XAE7_AGRPL|nr:uncharacterized protein LOC108742327 [Agrilus planipennis]